MVKLLKDFDPSELKFKPVRKTTTGSRIIDVDCEGLILQTGWLPIIYDIEYNICVNSDKIKEILEKIDKRIVEYSCEILDFTKEEIIKMYRPLLKQTGNFNCFSISILTNTLLFDRDKNVYDKSEIKNVLKKGQYVRLLFNFKKIYFKDHELTFPLELQQIELA